MQDNARVAKGAGRAMLGRFGAIIEAGSVVAFAWAYGAATFGLFAVLWSYAKILSVACGYAMPRALQRFVPYHERNGDSKADAVVGLALIIGFLLSVMVATGLWVSAPGLAEFIAASEENTDHLATIIRIYVWVIPLWTIVEIAVSAVRARRTFGPEIKVRIFYEQSARLIAAMVFAAFGWLTYGLFLAHLLSVGLAALLALRLVGRFYDWRKMSIPSLSKAETKQLLAYATSILPSSIIKLLFSELPVMLLNAWLPGAEGAKAGGYYSIARKIGSAMQIVRLTFEYVMTPLAAEKAGHEDRESLAEMIRFSTRMAITLALPLAGAMITVREGFLLAMPPEFMAASAAIMILVMGRLLETITGPSSSVIDALGHQLLPSLNAIAGIFALIGLGMWLIPLYGVTGAAIAAAVGMNVTAWLALFEMKIFYQLSLFSKHGNGGILIGTISFTLSLLLVNFVNFHELALALVGVLLLFGTLIIQIRYGLTGHDALALGRVGRLLRPDTRNTGQSE